MDTIEATAKTAIDAGAKGLARERATPTRGRWAHAKALMRACRPRQWVKNVLVLAAPGAAGLLTHPDIAMEVAGAFACFCLLSSCTYLLNDVKDREEDARHPRRRARPIAAGEVSVALALATAALLGLLGLGLAFAIAPLLGVTGVGYLTLTIGYSLRLRQVAVADLAIVAAGFVLRALAGGAATGVPVSRWFVIVTSFGALFLVASKRFAELRSEGVSAGTRASLRSYSEDYLRFVMLLSASVTTAAYCLWAVQGRGHDGLSLYEMTVAPFVLWLLRYGLLVYDGGGETPEDLVLRDRFLMTMSGAWAAVFACAVYVGT